MQRVERRLEMGKNVWGDLMALRLMAESLVKKEK